jgi:hypothetical protein
MIPKQKALELSIKMCSPIDVFKPNLASNRKAIVAVNRNIEMFTDLVNGMDDFSNESRQVIWQLIEDEQNVKEELEKL